MLSRPLRKASSAGAAAVSVALSPENQPGANLPRTSQALRAAVSTPVLLSFGRIFPSSVCSQFCFPSVQLLIYLMILDLKNKVIRVPTPWDY